MNARKIREDLGRARACIQRRDYLRAIYLFCLSLKDLGNLPAPMDLRGDFRTTLADLCSDPIYKKEFAQPLSYQHGKEKELLVFFHKFYKQLMAEENSEDYEQTRQRKLNLDRCLNDGKVFISQGKITEADNCFNEAFKYYKDEFAIYSMMAKAVMQAGHYVRALGYARKGLAEKPDDPELRQIAAECMRLRTK